MEYRFVWTGFFTVFAALTFCSCSQNDKMRPPAVSFKIQKAPVVPRTPGQMGREVGIKVSYMPKNTYARKRASSMRPRFITIHSTANPKGDANAHSRYLNSGKSRSLNWHFTVDQFGAYQHIPTTETGHHADHSGPGDQYSVAIEMCECTTHNPVCHLQQDGQAGGAADDALQRPPAQRSASQLLVRQELPRPADD